MNPGLRKEYKHSKNLCPAKEMDLIFLLKPCEMSNKHDGHCPECPTSGPHSPLARVEGTLAFPKTRDSLLRVHREIPHVTRGLRGAPQSPRLRVSLTWSAWAGAFPPPSTVVGLFRRGAIGQAPQPARTIGTFNNLYVGASTDLSFTSRHFFPTRRMLGEGLSFL